MINGLDYGECSENTGFHCGCRLQLTIPPLSGTARVFFLNKAAETNNNRIVIILILLIVSWRLHCQILLSKTYLYWNSTYLHGGSKRQYRFDHICFFKLLQKRRQDKFLWIQRKTFSHPLLLQNLICFKFACFTISFGFSANRTLIQ